MLMANSEASILIVFGVTSEQILDAAYLRRQMLSVLACAIEIGLS
jgi:hypothetical protein